jgi:ABC-type lipoprotein release transport system permease subunit
MMALLAWKNIWRNKRRSLVIIAATTIGLTAGLFYVGIITDMYDAIISSAINRELGDLKIRTEGYRKDQLLGQFLPGPDSLLRTAEADSNVRSAAPHCLVEGMASSATVSSGVLIVAVDPEKERHVTGIADNLSEGSYLDTKNSIVVGKKLADKLKLRLRSRMVLSFAGLDGTIVYAAFRIAGTFHTDGSMFDESTVFIRQDDLAPLMGTPHLPIHEILVRVRNPSLVGQTKIALQSMMPAGTVVETWADLAPELKLGADSADIVNMILLGIVLFALLFGLTNTLLMSVLDRTRDFGVLLAIGMYRHRMFSMIILESLFLSFTGCVIGVMFGWVLTKYFHAHGIDLSAFSAGLSEFGMPSILHPYIRSSVYGSLAVMMTITSVLAALYPAIKAIRLRPVQAIRTIA